MFCKSREVEKMYPVVFYRLYYVMKISMQQYNRIDELFYYTMKAIVDRLERDVRVCA